ncbi:MAG: hypothetical protein U0T02_06845 [Solirubrobacteraceae bacterium]
MGLLDDAIKEHLDLKRRHGADPGEVARQESEALGPVRREVEPAAEDGSPDATPFDVEVDRAPEPAARADRPTAQDRAPEPSSEAPADEHAATQAAGQPTEHFDVLGDDKDAVADGGPAAAGDELFAPGEEPFADDAAKPPAEGEGERERGAEPSGEDDVLEETPDFLQETPEHDRLWFEQKPPKDFDFDE